MDILIYALALIASYLGLVLGAILSSITSEETEDAAKYLKYFNILIIPSIILAATYNANKAYAIIFALIILTLLILYKDKYNMPWIYNSMGALLYVSAVSRNLAYTAIFIAIYGISIATIEYGTYFKTKTHTHIKISDEIKFTGQLLKKYAVYLLIGAIFFVIFSLIL